MTFHRVRLGLALVGLAGATAALLPAGCGGSVIEDICDAICDCTGCSDAAYRDCVDSAAESQKAAEDAACVDMFDEFVTCIDEELECGDDEKASYDACKAEEKALRECGVSLFRSVCEVANDFINIECGFGGFIDPSQECSGQVECQAECIVDTTCEGITGQNGGEQNRFFNCINACFQVN